MVSFDDIIKNNRYEIEDGLYIFKRPGSDDMAAPISADNTNRCPYCGSAVAVNTGEYTTGGWAWRTYACGVMTAQFSCRSLLGTSAPTEACKETSRIIHDIDVDTI